jgi:hypothetical protein
MRDFKLFLAEQELGASGEDAIRFIKGLHGRLTTSQWDKLIGLMKQFVAENTDTQSHSVGWNISGGSPPDQPPHKEPRTLPPS